MPTEVAPPQKSKLAVWHAFTQPAAWTMFLLGFSSGLPFLLVSYTVAIWLRKHGIVLKEITMIASAGMVYALKFLWAPLLDHVKLPGALGRLGQRRSWLLLAQLAVMIGLMAMAKLTPTQSAAVRGGDLASSRSSAPPRTSRSTRTASRSRQPPRKVRWSRLTRSAIASR